MRVDLTKTFGKFAGREVPMNEKTEDVRIGCVIKKRTVATPVDENPPVVQEMKDEATKHGLKLRVLWPGRGWTDDYDRKRVNVHVEKAKDGKYRISNKFDLG
ncbi:MAG: hypothetical protein ACAH80_04905 [Alphaproteobacteria bacterium]